MPAKTLLGRTGFGNANFCPGFLNVLCTERVSGKNFHGKKSEINKERGRGERELIFDFLLDQQKIKRTILQTIVK